MKKIANNQFVDTLTLEEKATLVSGKNYWYTADIKRVGLEKMMVTDGPSGLRKQAEQADALGLNKSVEAINFPTASLTACSFDREALKTLGNHLGLAAKSEQVGVLLGPGINMKRSPLAGRNFEYFSEDPYLAGELGVAYVTGVQNKNVGVSVKHFAANNRENQRFTASSRIDERTLREIYLRAFEKVVKEAAPATVMCSYNPLNGVLNAQNSYLLTDILRKEWNFDGLVISDWGAVADHVASLKAGLDLEMPGKGEESVKEIVAAVHDGKLPLETLNQAVLRVLTMVEKYGADTDKAEDYDKETQHAFARELAANSMVLLKNENQILPINKKEKILIVGELAENPRYQGGGSSHVNAYRVSTPLKVAESDKYNYRYAQGYAIKDQAPDEKLINLAIEAAKTADKIIVFAGFPESLESEGYDKETALLPDNQNQLIEQLSAVHSKVIVVLQNGSSVLMPWIEQVQAVLETYLAGEAVGEATLDVLSGAVNPSGKLAETFPKRIEDNPTSATFDVSQDEEVYHEGLFIGYRYYEKKLIEPLFPFGHGLSYTTFDYETIDVTETSSSVDIAIQIKNSGTYVGSEVVQVYCANMTSTIEKPIKELRDFVKVTLQPNETKIIDVSLPLEAFAWYNSSEKKWQVDNGTYELSIGSSSADIRLTKKIELSIGEDVVKPITVDTYLADILHQDEFKNILKESGIGDALNQLVGDTANSKLLENIPLRAAEMTGITSQQVEKFIKLANQKKTR